jgi:hypothetical protein
MLDIKIVYCNNPKNPSPAIANRVTGTVFLNIPYIKKYTPAERVFIVLHEIAHIFLQTKNEFEADQWAFDQYIKMGYKLTDAVKALTHTLHDTNQEHLARAQAQFIRAKNTDNMHNYISPESNFFGKIFTTKEGKERRQGNRQMRLDNREGRRNQKIANQTTLAGMGISERMLKKANSQNMIGGIAGAATGIAGMALGGGAAGAELGNSVTNALRIGEDGQPMQIVQTDNGAMRTTNNVDKKWYQKTGVLVGIGSGVVVLVAAGIMIYKNRKKK